MSPTLPHTAPGRAGSRRLSHVAALALLPWILLALDDAWVYSPPGTIDPWLYHGFMRQYVRPMPLQRVHHLPGAPAHVEEHLRVREIPVERPRDDRVAGGESEMRPLNRIKLRKKTGLEPGHILLRRNEHMRAM